MSLSVLLQIFSMLLHDHVECKFQIYFANALVSVMLKDKLRSSLHHETLSNKTGLYCVLFI